MPSGQRLQELAASGRKQPLGAGTSAVYWDHQHEKASKVPSEIKSRVYVMLAPGFEEVDVSTVTCSLRRAGFSVTVVGLTAGLVRGALAGCEEPLTAAPAGRFARTPAYIRPTTTTAAQQRAPNRDFWR